MNTKKRFKLYKSGKLWCCAAVLFGALTFGGASLAHADQLAPSTEQAAVSQSAVQDSQLAVSDASSNSADKNMSANSASPVPVDNTTTDNQANANYGHLDNYSLSQNNQGNAVLNASGWQASGQANKQRYRWAIVYDNTAHREVLRQAVNPVTRTDVQRAYPHVVNSLNSGFNLHLVLPDQAVTHALSLVMRYSNDPVHGEGQSTSYWFGPLHFDAGNHAWLDSISSDPDHGTVTVSGWHATNASAGRPYHYIIAYDSTAHREIARQLVSSDQSRTDVAQAYPTIFNAGNSGFMASFAFTPAMGRDTIQFLSRWTNDPSGNGSAVDYWFSPISKQNRGYLDGYNISSGNLQVAGWHANDASIFQPYHFLIVFDRTSGRQVASSLVPSQASPDVSWAYGHDTKTAGQARFDYAFPKLSLQAGHQYAIVSRYSAIKTGNGDDGQGSHTDYWYPAFSIDPDQKAGWIDNLQAHGSQLTVSGWLANNAALSKPYAYAILLAGDREIGRQTLTFTARPDVGQAYPHILQSAQSGFTTTFDLPASLNGDLQVVLRYTDDPAGNGHASDIWSRKFASNAGYFDQISSNGQQLTLTGWHAAMDTADKPYQYIIAVDADNGHELGRWGFDNRQKLSRTDIAKSYAWINDSGQSGFSLNIPQARFSSRFVRFIHRYTDDRQGNGHYLDVSSRTCYFDPASHQLVTNRFLSLPNQDRTVYFGNDGQMALGNTFINGKTYHFDSRTGKFYSFSQRVIDWFRNRRGRLTYSQWGSRNGSDGTADCSGSITQAIRDAGGYNYGHIYHDNYDTKHWDFYSYITGNGYHQVYSGRGQYTPQYGDIVVWNPFESNGRSGHAMVISTFGDNPNVISVCGYTHNQRGTAVQEFNYNWYWNYDGRPNQVVFRPNDLSRA